jgi:Spy/CpxP family protein refolding chaperone
MKKTTFLAFLLLATTLVFAQRPEGGRRTDGGRGQFSAEEIAKRNTDWMTKDLNLTEEQIAPVDSINLLYAKAQVVLFQSATGDRDAIREAIRELGVKKEEALSAVLTDEQLDLYKKKMSERGNRRNRGNGG